MKFRTAISRSRHIWRIAFTLTELLVVLGVVALLMLIILPALAGSSVVTKITHCATNLRQINSSLQAYANENNDNLPATSGGYWPWDINGSALATLDNYGAGWKVMFCPGTAPRFNEADNLTLYNYALPNFGVVGYALTIPNAPGLATSNRNSTLTPKPVDIGFGTLLPPPLPSERVLVADATISMQGQNNPALTSGYNFTSIVGGYPKYHLSPHLDGKLPSGANLSMLDGHTEWRNFEDMVPRTSSVTSPVFWW